MSRIILVGGPLDGTDRQMEISAENLHFPVLVANGFASAIYKRRRVGEVQTDYWDYQRTVPPSVSFFD